MQKINYYCSDFCIQIDINFFNVEISGQFAMELIFWQIKVWIEGYGFAYIGWKVSFSESNIEIIRIITNI